MPFGFQQSQSVHLPVPCCRHQGPAHRENPATISKLHPKHPTRLLWSLGCTCEALQCLFHGGILVSVLAQLSQYSQPCAGGMSQSKHRASRSLSLSSAFLCLSSAFHRGFGLCPHLRGCAMPALCHRNSGLHTSPGAGGEQHSSQQWEPAKHHRQHTEPPEKPHQQLKDKPLVFSGLKFSH